MPAVRGGETLTAGYSVVEYMAGKLAARRFESRLQQFVLKAELAGNGHQPMRPFPLGEKVMQRLQAREQFNCRRVIYINA